MRQRLALPPFPDAPSLLARVGREESLSGQELVLSERRNVLQVERGWVRLLSHEKRTCVLEIFPLIRFKPRYCPCFDTSYFQQAVCCSDGEHCCPQGMTCDVAQGKCTQGSFSVPFLSSGDAKATKTSDDVNTVCPNGDSCPSGDTCCKSNSGGYGCCPEPNVGLH